MNDMRICRVLVLCLLAVIHGAYGGRSSFADTFTLTRPLKDGMSLTFRDHEFSGGFNVSWTNLLVNAYLDTANQRVRILGYAAGSQNVPQIVYTATRSVEQPFPNPPTQVTGTVTVRLKLPTGGLLFDTGYQGLTFDQTSGAYTIDAGVLQTIRVDGDVTVVTGEKTYATNFTYSIHSALGGAFTFSRLSTADYPRSIGLSGFGWTGGMFSYRVGVDTAAQLTAENGFQATIKPGGPMWGLFAGESFNWSFGAQQGLPGGAGIDYTVVTALPGEAPLLPVIVTQPFSVRAAQGSTVSFSVEAAGQPPLAYQWYFDGNPITDANNIQGARSNTLTLNVIAMSQAGTYSVAISNVYGGKATSSGATLQVELQPVTAPSIISQPASITVVEGESGMLRVVAAGTDPLTYQWFRNGVPIAGATSPDLTLTNIQVGSEGSYTVHVKNGGGTATSPKTSA